jgi:hypothetical protein
VQHSLLAFSKCFFVQGIQASKDTAEGGDLLGPLHPAFSKRLFFLIRLVLS